MESSGSKYDCSNIKIMLALKKLNTCLYTIIFITFSNVLSGDIGLKLLQSVGSSFLNIGVTLASFHALGTLLDYKDKLDSLER